jgi:hypothetical protein
VVTEVRVPQAELLHPVPASDQLMIALGFEPATGLRVATITAVADVLTVPGAASCSVKWLVMATIWLARFEGSATGAAAQLPSNGGVGLTGAGEGRGKTLFASKLHACRGG